MIQLARLHTAEPKAESLEQNVDFTAEGAPPPEALPPAPTKAGPPKRTLPSSPVPSVAALPRPLWGWGSRR